MSLSTIAMSNVLELKKEYKFIWYLGRETKTTRWKKASGKSIESDEAEAIGLTGVFNPLFTAVMTLLCKKVDLPDDEVETEDYDVGLLQFPVVRKVNMNDITVTYFDDALNTVYNTHKTWMSIVRRQYGMATIPIYQLTATGRYITIENTMEANTYAAIHKQLEDGDLTVLENLLNIPTSITSYPELFPVKISRSPADKSGTGLAEVTVTYRRYPDFQGARPAFMRISKLGITDDSYDVGDSITTLYTGNSNFDF